MANGKSPNGKLCLAMTGSGSEAHLEISDAKTKSVIGSIDVSSYAVFPFVANPDNTVCLWAPDSTHFILMVRSTKRTWDVSIYSVQPRVRKLPIPDLTAFALAALHEESNFRWSRETPLQWHDATHVILRLEGDCGTPPNVLLYSGEVSVCIDGKVTLKAPFKTEKEEG